MTAKEGDIISLLGKKYTYGMLRSLEKGSKRFKGMAEACEGDKMRAQRLREMESLNLIRIRAKRVGRRAVSVYSLSEKGRAALKLAEGMKRLESENSK